MSNQSSNRTASVSRSKQWISVFLIFIGWWGRRNIAQHTYMCRYFRKYRPCRDVIYRPCRDVIYRPCRDVISRTEVYWTTVLRSYFLFTRICFYSVGLTIRLRNAPYRNHCMVLLMLNMLLLAVPHSFQFVFEIRSHFLSISFFAWAWNHLMQGLVTHKLLGQLIEQSCR